MKRVIVAGVGPIPPWKPAKLYAPGLRLWGFADTLEQHGHRVILCEATFAEESQDREVSENLFKNRHIKHYSIPLDSAQGCERFREIVSLHNPDCVISSTDVINCTVSLAGLGLPCWFDFFGHPMTERQMQAKIYDSDEGVIEQWFTILPALLSGDHFSVCSEAQKSALIGELGTCGRLNKFTAGIDMVDVIRPGLVMSELKGIKGAIRNKLVGEEEVVVLYTGGYNTWMDEHTLFDGLEYAMSRNPRVHFISTGGAIKGHNEITFERFRSRVEASTYKDRYHFCGWVPTETIADYYLEADISVNVDLFSYEGLFGTRNRVLEWVAAGLPVITTPLSEVTEDLVSQHLVATFDYGESEQLGKHIVTIASDPASHRLKATRAQEYVLNKYKTSKVVHPLLNWLESPVAAPDLPSPKSRERLQVPICPYNSLSRFWVDMYLKHQAGNDASSDQRSAPLSGLKRIVSSLGKIFKAS